MGQAFMQTALPLNVAGTTSNQSSALTEPEKGNSLRIYNGAAAAVAFRTGAGAQTAVTTDMRVGPGATEVFRKPPSHTHIGVILLAGTGDVQITVGEGQ